MNKKDLIPVIIIVALMMLWMFIDRTFIAPKLPAPRPVAKEQPAEPVSTGAPAELTASEPEKPAAPAEINTTVPADEIIQTLENDKLKLELTSIGGGIKSATLFEYPALNEKGSGPVAIEFSDRAALAYSGLTGIGAHDSLNITKSDDGRSVVFSKVWNTGAEFRRTLTLDSDYSLSVTDRFINTTSNPWNLPALRLLTGTMANPVDIKAMKGLSILGVDSHTPDGGVNYWGRKLSKLYKQQDKPASIDVVPEDMQNVVVDWVAAKNKFFTQIVSPAKPTTMSVLSSRDTAEKGIIAQDIAASLDYPPAAIEPGDALELNYTYYVGPKKFSALKDAGHNFEKVMEFETTGFWSFMNWMMEPARKFLLWALNMFFAVVKNYGIAIILLTLLMRILFWPLTHKSTESMKKMQEVQPQIKALQEKYKSEPQRAQQEVMKFYRENKINPMGGCLPMVVQMPVFFALFTVLRNAIELRYAGFLWIADLSQPENLFAGQIPVIGSLNILDRKSVV